MLFPPISLRHALTVLMLILCVLHKSIKIDKFLGWYLLFMFFYALSATITGYGEYVLNKFLGTYIASIVLYFSTKLMVTKYKAAPFVLYSVLSIAVLNAIVVIMQFYHFPLADVLPQLLHVDLGEDMADYYENTTDFTGRYVGGLMGAVRSGYLLSAACVLVLYNKQWKISIVNLILFAIIFYALMLVQERSGLITGAICTTIFFFILIRKKTLGIPLMIFGAVLIFVVVSYGTSLISFEESRYVAVGMMDERRVNAAVKAMEYVFNNPLGGSNDFFASGGYYPHNFFVNALLYGGVFGGTILIVLLLSQLLLIAKIIYANIVKNKYSSLIIVSCIAYLSYTINSFAHNASLVLGTEMFFLFWSMITALLSIEDPPKEKTMGRNT